MNKKNLIIFVITIIFAISIKWTLTKKSENFKLNQKLDKVFIECLDNSLSSLNHNYKSIKKETIKLRYYAEVLSNLRISKELALYTSYYEDNKLLDDALDSAYLFMQNEKYKDIVMKKQIEIYNYILDIRLNPTDIKTTKALIDFINQYK